MQRRLPLFLLSVSLLAGCAGEEKQDRDFYTSGSREADQRAEVLEIELLRDQFCGQLRPPAPWVPCRIPV